MDNKGTKSTKALFIVVNAGYANEVMEIARSVGAKGATILNARGESSMHKSIAGITVDAEREIILTLIDSDIADKIMAELKEKAGRPSGANSVCFTLPVEKTTAINNFESQEA